MVFPEVFSVTMKINIRLSKNSCILRTGWWVSEKLDTPRLVFSPLSVLISQDGIPLEKHWESGYQHIFSESRELSVQGKEGS